MSKRICRIKRDEMLLTGSIDERLPVIRDELTVHFPFDGTLNKRKSLDKDVKVLGWHYDNTSHPWYDYLNINCSLTNVKDIMSITSEQAKQYDLLIFDAYAWHLSSEEMTKIKGFVDEGISCITIGNDTGANVFVKAIKVDSSIKEDFSVKIDDFAPISTTKNSYQNAGNADCLYWIEELQNGAFPYYYREHTNYIMGYLYISPVSGAVLYHDQIGIKTGLDFETAGIQYALNLSKGNLVHQNLQYSNDGVFLGVDNKLIYNIDSLTKSEWTINFTTTFDNPIADAHMYFDIDNHSVCLYNDGNLTILSRKDDNNIKTSITTDAKLGEEVMLTVVKKNNNYLLYQNAVYINSLSVGKVNTSKIHIGTNHEHGQFLLGTIKNFSFYSKALSDIEINKLYSPSASYTFAGNMITSKVIESPTDSFTPIESFSWSYSNQNLLNPEMNFYSSGQLQTKDFFGKDIKALYLGSNIDIGGNVLSSPIIPIDSNSWYLISIWVYVEKKDKGNLLFNSLLFNNDKITIDAINTPTVAYLGMNPAKSDTIKNNQWFQMRGYVVPQSANIDDNFNNKWINTYLVEQDNIKIMSEQTKYMQLVFSDYDNNNIQSHVWVALPTISKISPVRYFKDKTITYKITEGVIL